MIGRRRKGVTPTPDALRAEGYELLAEADRADAIAEADRNRVPLADAVTRAAAVVAELESERDDAAARQAEADRRLAEAQRHAIDYASAKPADFHAEVDVTARAIVAERIAAERTAEAEAAATARADADRRLTEARRTLAEATVDLDDHDADVTAERWHTVAPTAHAARVSRDWVSVLLDESNTADRPEALARLRDLLLVSGEGARIADAVKRDTYREIAHRFSTRDYDVLTADGLHIGGGGLRNGRTANLPA